MTEIPLWVLKTAAVLLLLPGTLLGWFAVAAILMGHGEFHLGKDK